MIVSLRRFSFARPFALRAAKKDAKVTVAQPKVEKRTMMRDFEAMLEAHARVLLQNTTDY